jgi:SAM-dependent methyltransferase
MKKIALKANYTDIEYPSCPLCQDSNYAVCYEHSPPFRIVQCCSCGFYYLSPRLTETTMMNLYRDETYFQREIIGYQNYFSQEQTLRATFRQFMRNLQKRGLTGGSLLEIGCGYGFLLEEAEQFFSVRVGTELSHRAVECARSRGEHIYEGGMEQIPLDRKFDCIIAIHVIEHIYQPLIFLKQIAKQLNHGGKIIIATPDMGSIWRRLMRHRWPSFKVPEHILYFDKTTLKILMKRAGLMGVDILPYPHAFPLSLVASKLNISLPDFIGKVKIWLPGTTIAMIGYIV